MISNRRQASSARSPQGRAWVLPLLVMAVLCGVLAMHGIGSAPSPEAHGHGSMSHSAPAAGESGHGQAAQGHAHDSRPMSGSQYVVECECGGTDGHVAHADATCSASGTSGSPSMDGPAAVTAPGPQTAGGSEVHRPRTDGERPPPSLHRLQLLRI
ncbi:DUF6153 family protein [Streptomyces winkii]|uniref:DUF6153 family protein n=1 Tax=Streptomyces winkii TaxID=3051178 RepID=UPI0028D2BF05|nr:DUF6153 family protein [Streptomyces sp. DSM 40971]